MKSVLTFTQKLAIHKKLEEEIETTSEGFCKYKNTNVNDGSIAKEFNVSVSNVLGIRQEVFGKLKSHTKKEKAKNYYQQSDIELLINKYNELFKKIDIIQSDLSKTITLQMEILIKYNKLVDTLSLNKIANVIHLKA